MRSLVWTAFLAVSLTTSFLQGSEPAEVTIGQYDCAKLSAADLGDTREEASSSFNVSGADRGIGGMAITVRVYNLANLPSSIVRSMGNDVSRIFDHSKITVNWLDCAQPNQRPRCEERLRPGDLMLRLLAVDARSRSFSESPIMGRARGGVIADVLCLPVDALPVMAQTIPVQVLGHTAAHEIGHLLLGPGSHYHQGIMRPGWGDDDFRKITARFLLFTPEQAQTMRQALRARYERAQVAQK